MPYKLNLVALYVYSKFNPKLSVLEREGRPDMYLIIQCSVLLYRDIWLKLIYDSYVRILRKRVSYILCPFNKEGGGI